MHEDAELGKIASCHNFGEGTLTVEGRSALARRGLARQRVSGVGHPVAA